MVTKILCANKTIGVLAGVLVSVAFRCDGNQDNFVLQCSIFSQVEVLIKVFPPVSEHYCPIVTKFVLFLF